MYSKSEIISEHTEEVMLPMHGALIVGCGDGDVDQKPKTIHLD